MDWNFSDIKPNERMAFVDFTIEGGVNGWLKKFSRTRGIARSHAIRLLVTQAVTYWLKVRQPLSRHQEYPWEEFTARGLKVQRESVKLDVRILHGLREIAELSGKTSSRVVSEMLLDAMNAQAEMQQAGKNVRKKAAARPLLDRIAPEGTQAIRERVEG